MCLKFWPQAVRDPQGSSACDADLPKGRGLMRHSSRPQAGLVKSNLPFSPVTELEPESSSILAAPGNGVT